MKRVIIFLIVASLLILTACESTTMYANSAGECPKYIMPDNLICYKMIKADYSGQIRFTECDNGRTYITPEYYSSVPYLSNSSVC